MTRSDLSVVGRRYEDKDSREAGRIVEVVSVEYRPHGGPLVLVKTVANKDPWKVGKTSKLSLDGLLKRWRLVPYSDD